MSRSPLNRKPARVVDLTQHGRPNEVAASTGPVSVEGVSDRPAPLRLTNPVAHLPAPRTAGQAAKTHTPFVDRLVSHMAEVPGRGHDKSPDRLQARHEPPVLPAPQRPADLPGDADAERPCTLLLTADFQIRPPQVPVAERPFGPPAPRDYAEDSDLDQAMADGLQALSEAEMSEVLRTALGKTLEVQEPRGSLATEAEPTTPYRPETDNITEKERLRSLVREIIREEVEGMLGAQLARRVRVLVRTEMARKLEENASGESGLLR